MGSLKECLHRPIIQALKNRRLSPLFLLKFTQQKLLIIIILFTSMHMVSLPFRVILKSQKSLICYFIALSILKYSQGLLSIII